MADACFDSSTVAAPNKPAGRLLHTLLAGRPGKMCAFNVGSKLTVIYSLSEAVPRFVAAQRRCVAW